MGAIFPVAVVRDGAIQKVFWGPEPFECDGIQHPSSVWEHWRGGDWAAACPGWMLLPVVDSQPPCAWFEALTRKHEADWVVGSDVVSVAYSICRLDDAEALAMMMEVRADAVLRINAAAGEARARHLTMVPGQEAAYAAKEAEARAYMDDTAPEASRYPYLSAESRHTGIPMDDIAVDIIAAATKWAATAAEIEGLRRGAVVRVAAAKSPAEVLDCFPAFF